jgi:hypothetical protein
LTSQGNPTEEAISIEPATESGADTGDYINKAYSDGTGIVKRESTALMDEINLNELATDTQDNLISANNEGPSEIMGADPNEIDASVEEPSKPAPVEPVPASNQFRATGTTNDCGLDQPEPNFNVSDTVEQSSASPIDQIEEDNTYDTENIVVDKLPNDLSIQNASTEEEAEWLSMGLGLSDALKQIVALTDERDVALAMCQEREGQSDLTTQSEALLVEVQSRLQSEMEQHLTLKFEG